MLLEKHRVVAHTSRRPFALSDPASGDRPHTIYAYPRQLYLGNRHKTNHLWLETHFITKVNKLEIQLITICSTVVIMEITLALSRGIML